MTNAAEITKLQQQTRNIYVAEAIVDYIVSIVDRLRHDPDVFSGPSTRAGIALFKCARALALLEERDFVIPDDVKRLIVPAVEHRMIIKPEAEMDDIHPKDVIDRVMEQIPVPRIQA